jgi:hypothetical protein
MAFTKEQRDGIVDTLASILPDLIEEWERINKKD